MSGATHSPLPVRQQLARNDRRARAIALATVATIATLLVALVLILTANDSPTAGPDAPTGQSTQDGLVPQIGSYPIPDNVAENLQPGRRYDGGPEEGTRGPAR